MLWHFYENSAKYLTIRIQFVIINKYGNDGIDFCNARFREKAVGVSFYVCGGCLP